jgi:hypothetical protein
VPNSAHRLTAVRSGRSVTTPLNLPCVLDHLVPALAAVLRASQDCGPATPGRGHPGAQKGLFAWVVGMTDDDSIDRAAVRRNTWRFLIAFGGLVLVAGAAGALVGAFHGDDGGGGPRHPFVALVAVVGVAAVTLGTAGLALWWMLRRPSYQQVMQFGWAERRQAFKAVKAGRPLDPRQVRIVRATLDYFPSSRWFLWLQPLLIAIWVFNGLTLPNLIGRLQLALAVLYAVMFPVLLWQRRRVIGRYQDALARSR